MNRSYIYLACPYTHADPEIMEERFKSATLAASWIRQQGYLVFSPITHSHPMALIRELPRDFSYWQADAELMVGFCKEIVILKIEGWERSTGIRREVELAYSLSRPVSFMIPLPDGSYELDQIKNRLWI